MALSINAHTVDGAHVPSILVVVPDKCPVCEQSGQPNFCYAATRAVAPGSTLFAVFRCPVVNCRALYVGNYYWEIHTNPYRWNLQKTSLSRYIEKKVFPANIEKISPAFCLTFNQALVAEQNQLDQICGPGFRKALEFLVKDYLVLHLYKNDPTKQEVVKKAFLAPAIENHIDQEKIKQCAKRAVWLGNDEVHYTRKWEGKDINDLKSLILITVNHIDLTIESDRYLEEMPASVG